MGVERESEENKNKQFFKRLNVLIFFFFQAEDGIRDIGVTGVQTCALPISVTSNLCFDRDEIIERSRDWRP